MKSISASFLALLIALLSAAFTTPSEAKGVRDYYTTINPFYQAGYGGQCTSYTWGRTYEYHGISLPFRGNAKTWWTSNSSYSTSQSAVAGSIAVWGGDSSNPYGHVAFVEYVSGSTVTISEGNYSTFSSRNGNYGGGYDGSYKALSTTQMNNRAGAGMLLGYILVKAANRAPQVYSLGAVSSAAAITVTFSASDPDGDRMGYDVYLFTSAGSTGIRKTGSSISSGNQTVTFYSWETAALGSGLQCYVRVDLFDPYQAKGQATSPWFMFTKGATVTNSPLDRFQSANSSWLGSRTTAYSDSYYDYRIYSTGTVVAQARNGTQVWYYRNGSWTYAGNW